MTTPPAARSVHTLRPGDHLCLSYTSNAQQQRVLIEFVRDGLVAGEKILWFTDTATPEAATGPLLRHGIGPDHVERGQVEVVSADEAFLAGGYFDPDRTVEDLRVRITQALESGYPAIRMTGEMSWALGGVPGTERLLEYETKLRPLLHAHPAMAVCQYDVRVFAPQKLAAFTRAHSGQVGSTAPGNMDTFADVRNSAGATDPPVRITRTEEPLGLRVTGEVDLMSHWALGEALTTVVEASAGDVHLDLTELDFIDAAGVRLIAISAAALPPERRLVVHRPSPQLRRVLGCVGCDPTPGLVLIGGDR